MAYLYCDGVIELADGPSTNIDRFTCSTGWSVEVNDLSFVPAEDLDPILIVNAVAVGFFVLMPLWAVISGGRILINAIKSS